MMQIHYGETCGNCTHCSMRRVDVNSEIIKFIYDIYCNIDDKSIGSLHSQKAELCSYFEERNNK